MQHEAQVITPVRYCNVRDKDTPIRVWENTQCEFVTYHERTYGLRVMIHSPKRHRQVCPGTVIQMSTTKHTNA
ncbi:hypothetical protein FOVSG1_007634 [Fusarium oxysporum f. sp. vasinfectum]